ncbi:hypothetical protein KXX57_009302 [Aspergillus fumigatus]|nr:hypothetical protein KXX57_009302 [Aspergillus fumigatus]KAH1981863.1 hypothetical protein KXW88_005251 [Aspergillus fumigatus]KAH2653389.1 hypothetical protein KXV32_003431 [Aspergillus fumigatus]KAH2914619.1 hypothetical protein KXW25_009396 [Aspergillus fumigatus]KAH3142509.1 hypothetical protein KXW18_000839 [Aspergillus fumigatus]
MPSQVLSSTDAQSHASLETSVDQGLASPEAQHKTRPRMLRSLQGERVYVGRAASLSFLQLLRDTVTQHIGPSQFSHNVKLEDMLETEAPRNVSPDFEDQLDLQQRESLLRAYQISTSGFLYLMPDSELRQLLRNQRSDTGHAQHTTALLDIMIAIGAQSQKHDPTKVQIEHFFFARGQRRAFVSMLENPSLEMVSLFLLMSFYMLGACRRNAAFMYLGVAARAAVALGLHIDVSGSLSVSEQQRRACVWMSLCSLDLLVSSILGRPPATASLRSESGGSISEALQRNDLAEERLVALYNLAQILDETITRLYSEKAASAQVAESILEKLKRWSDGLPEPLLAPPGTEQECVAAQDRVIGSLHIACSYHFAIIVVTRPFLISTLGVRLTRLLDSLAERSLGDVHSENPVHSRLALACTDSALYMLQTCLEIHRSHLLLGNMCILKAFIFAAALVVGFSLFSQKDPNPDLEEAFIGAIDILHTFSKQSAQAGHYYEILSFLRNAIAEQRQRLSNQDQSSKSQYVSKLFSLNGRRASRQTEGAATVNLATLTSPFDINSVPLEWECMELPFWDSFPFTEETLPLQDRTSDMNPL